MAVLGQAKLDAVNWLLKSINVPPVPALDSSGASNTSYPTAYGSSIQAYAENVLDEMTRQILTRGDENENIIPGQTLTADGSGNIIVPADTLRIVPSGKDKYRKVQLGAPLIDNVAGDQIYDLIAGTHNFGAAATLMVDRVFLKGYVNCSPTTKWAIVNEAMTVFQNRFRGSQSMDAVLKAEAARTEGVARSPMRNQPTNPLPIIVPPSAGGGQSPG